VIVKEGERMRRVDKEVTDRAWMEDVLMRADSLVLGMVDEAGKPYLVPLNFGYEDGAIYVHGAAVGKKVDALKANPYVCFQVYVGAEVVRCETDWSEFSMNYNSVTGFGTVTHLEGREVKNAALAILMKHYNGPTGDLGERHKHVWVARIDIESMTGKRSPAPRKKA
jgi:nitroimidazol reductase NimA-like FMN-containing flavoprotein (pyridoxamine 5'-phosphate oxidase superfamily)